MSITQMFAEEIQRLTTARLPESTLVNARSALVDHIAAAVYGARQPWFGIIARHALRESCGGPVPTFAGESMSPSLACRINGTAAHSFELDDLYEPGSLHPGAVVIPAALASAISTGASSERLLRGIIAGYEVMGRVSRATQSQMTAFHTTGTHGVLGAATAAAVVASATTVQIVGAWAVAASLGSGIKAFQTGGGEVKRLHPGRSSESGLMAWELTEAGLTGPSDVLENPRGFFAAYQGADPRPSILRTAQDTYVVDDMHVKQYASCSATHPVIEAIKRIRREHSLDTADIDNVRVGTSRRGLEQNSIPDPTKTMSVQYSIEAATVIALVGGADDPSSFEAANFLSSEARTLLPRVRLYLDPEVDRAYPQRMSGRVEVRLHDGREFAAEVAGLTSRLTAADRRRIVEEKFRRATRGAYSSELQDAILREVFSETLTVSTLAELVYAEHWKAGP